MTQLLRCPFCGTQPLLSAFNLVMCANSDCQCNDSCFPPQDWNTRTSDARVQALVDALEFYANQQNWRSGEQVNYDEHFDTPMSKKLENHGETARNALTAFREE